MPIWNSRLTAFDPEGRQTAQTDLGNVRLTRFAGELDDGTVAIAWRAQYANRAQLEPVFGWTLIAWNPATGARRRLATDLASLPSAENDASMIFLDRRGQSMGWCDRSRCRDEVECAMGCLRQLVEPG